MTDRPATVEFFAQALADWLSSFTLPTSLVRESVDACIQGSAWVGAVAGSAARAAEWDDPESVSWGIAVGAQAGALAAARRSIAIGAGVSRLAGASSESADALLAADHLVAASHEALSTLAPGRLEIATRAMRSAFRDGGPWVSIAQREVTDWTVLVPLACAPAAGIDAWRGYADAWRGWLERGRTGDPPVGEVVAAIDEAAGRVLRAISERVRAADG